MAVIPAAPAPVARTGAVASLSSQPQADYQRRHGQARSEPRWVQQQRDWETFARAYARFNGPAAFNALVVSDMCARCDIRVEERDDAGDWPETANPALLRVFDTYQNRWQNNRDLVRSHAWRYTVDGHAYMCFWDGDYGVEWGVFSTTAVQVDKPRAGQVTVKLIQEGKPDDGTAIVIPREQVFHVWSPDMEELLRPTSAMQASIEDLERYHALTRYAWRTAESRLAMEGVFWVPSEIMRDDAPPLDPTDEQIEGVGTARNSLEDKYYELAKLSFENNDDISAIAPPMFSSDGDAGKPEWVQVGRGLDDAGIAHRREAIEDAARPWPVPTTALMGGGVGDANHWSEWLASDKFIESGVAPTMDRVCHMDLTRVWLHRLLRFEGFSEQDVQRFRVGYGTENITVKPDHSDVAIKVHAVGGIGYKALRRETGFQPDDAPDEEDIATLLEVLSKGAQGDAAGAPLPAGPGTTVEAPPERPTAPPTAPPAPPSNGNAPVSVASVLASVLSHAHND